MAHPQPVALPIALMGATANIYLGGQLTEQLTYSTGLVYWPAFAGIVVMSIPCARLGARIAQKLPADKLRKTVRLHDVAGGGKVRVFAMTMTTVTVQIAVSDNRQ